MNKIYALILLAGFTIMSSCVRDPSKDDIYTNNTNNNPYVLTTISLVDSLGKNEIIRREATAKIMVTVNLSVGYSLKTARVERKIDMDAPEIVLDNDRMDTVTNFKAVDVFTDVIPGTGLTEGSMVTYTFTVTDSKLNMATANITYLVVRGNAVIISNEIELGAQLNSLSLPSFLGLLNDFTAYTSGTSGTAQANSYYIDFVYFYDPIDLNIIASPSNPNAQVTWATEISTWPRINDTKFKVTSINATDFDYIKNLSKVDDTFYNIDFLNGSTDIVTNFAVNDVVAFQNSVGKVGLIKFTQTSFGESGSMKLQIICQK